MEEGELPAFPLGIACHEHGLGGRHIVAWREIQLPVRPEALGEGLGRGMTHEAAAHTRALWQAYRQAVPGRLKVLIMFYILV